MKELVEDIESRADVYLARLGEMVEQPSISSQGVGLAEMAEKLAHRLEVIGFEVEAVPIDGPPVLLAHLEGRGDETLLLYNHYDVQPVDPLELWTTPPFEPTVRDGKLYGRGVADNKGDLIARLSAIESYLRVRERLPVNVVWVIEGEEEIGSPHLDQFVTARQDVLQDVMGCIWESGRKNADERYEMTLGCKGLLYVDLRVRKAARDLHSALAAIVPSPAWRLVWALNSIKGPDGQIRIPGFEEDVRPPSPAQRRAVAGWDYPEEKMRELYGIDAFLEGKSGRELKEALIFNPTCNIDGLHTGYGGPGSKTVLPNEAYAKIDFRLVPDQKPERVMELLRTYLDAQGFEDVEIVRWDGEAPAAGDMDHPFVQLATQTAEQVYEGAPVILPWMVGTGPVHLLCGQFDVPIVTVGIGYADARAHAPDENIRIADFVDGMKFIAALFDRLERA